MHGGESERKRRRHMWPVPAAHSPESTVSRVPQYVDKSTVGADSDRTSAADSLLKDGRRFVVGDCALFQAGKSPPFIGIIRWFSPDKRDNLKLGVSRLYRPSEVKLAKGILLEAAPNEVFYSFHKDEISAELLLHPCKVAFLRKGVELPQWVSSFVCRRVYDSANKCLWWLTDQDFIDDRQDEVAKLLFRTREEMHAAVQSGGRSPKQSKSGTDGLQNSGISSFTSHFKGKKRTEKADPVSDPAVKRERPSKPIDDGESLLKAEIEKITEKGAVTSIDAVDKLVQLLQADKVEKKIDLPGRVLLADVIAATDKSDCLMRFVQLKGMSLLDDWLQEAHKGKSGGDSASPKEGDKAVDELLLALLHALDKLPVNLEALQTCNVGKSVNHLRGHKNSEIQKKARGLFDTWKKRINVEMAKLETAKPNEAKATSALNHGATSWAGKPGLPEASHGGSKRGSGSSEALPKVIASQTLSACKSLTGKSSSGLSAPVKLAGPKDSQPKGGTAGFVAESPIVAAAEEKSSSSSQSCSSDHGKSPTSGSTHLNKAISGSSRLRKSSNGHLSSASPSSQKDSGLTKSSPLSRNAQIDKGPLHGQAGGERESEDHGNSQRVIVRLPNPGRSPAQSCFEESTSQSGGPWSMPLAVRKVDVADSRKKLKNDANADSWQTEDLKGTADRDDDAEGTTTPLLDAKHILADLKPGKVSELKRGKAFEASLSPMNALAESCAKYSEASASSGGDDSGMNLLASVATGEISKSTLRSPRWSPMRQSPAEEISAGKAINPGCPVNCLDEDSEKKRPNLAPVDGEKHSDPSEDCRSDCKAPADNKSQDIVSQSAPSVVVVSTENKESILKVMKAEEVKGILNEDDPGKPLRNWLTSSFPDSKSRVETPKSDESDHPTKSDVGDGCGVSGANNQVEEASSAPVDGASAVCLCDLGRVSTDGALEAKDDAKQEELDISAAKNVQVSQPETKNEPLLGGDLNGDHEETSGVSTKEEEPSVASAKEEQCPSVETSVAKREVTSPVAISPARVAPEKLDFDLNEGFSIDEGSTAERAPSPSAHLPNLLSFSISPVSNSSPATITVAAPAKGPFVPPETLLKSKGEPGWRGSAATSAFRPAEPRKILDLQSGPSISLLSDGPSAGRPLRAHLDIDLNVADERATEEFPTQVKRKNLGGLDLDLNRADESADGHPSASTSMLRNFDLNNGPIVDEAGADPAILRGQPPMVSNSLPFLPSLRLNNSEMGSLSTWFPPGNSYPAVAIPSFLPERVDQPLAYPIVAAPGGQRMLGSAGAGGIGPFGGDLYRGPVLSSSPAMTFSPAAAFSYAGFPFGSSFPLASTSSYSYPDPVPGGAPLTPGFTAVSSSYMRPYVISLHDGNGGGGGGPEGGRKWGQPTLDLNSGSGSAEMDSRASWNVSVPGSQGFAEDQSRLYQGRAMKRKEPDGGWDSERFSCK
ncbi:uncharacterized protein LOC144709592 [Wolffia australiana]